jgi:hypothetical protein
MEHYQVRLVKRIDNDGTIVTYPNTGKIYELHDQKTLKSYHTLDDAIARAKSFNQNLPPEVKGMVIVQFKAGGSSITSGSITKPHVRATARKSGTTEWLRFVDRKGDVSVISPGTHKI